MRAEAKTSTGQEDVAEPRLPIRKMSKGPQNGNSSSNESSLSMPSPPKVVGKLRVQVIGAQNLAAQDRNGFSDPFIIINLPGAPPPSTSSSSKKDKDFYRRRTPHQPKTLAPKWKESEGTFEWNITTDWYQSAAEADGKTGSESPEQVVKEKIKLVDTSAGYSESPQTEVNADPLQVAGSRLQAQPTSHRPSNVRKLSAATGKILSASVRAPVRMTAKGAVATTRAVRKRGPRRPMRIRKGSKSSIIDDSILHQASVGAIEFVVWDKDKWSGNDYMGECSLQVGSWIAEGKSAVWEASEVSQLEVVMVL
jgi:phosphatidylserine decarboxylase